VPNLDRREAFFAHGKYGTRTFLSIRLPGIRSGDIATNKAAVKRAQSLKVDLRLLEEER
jgi:hypothetical protein